MAYQRAKFAVGLFDRPAADPAKLATLNNAAHRAVARRVAVEGAILLQNANRTLPLRTGTASNPVFRRGGAVIKRVLFAGPSAGCADVNATDCSALREQVGGYHVLLHVRSESL